MPDTTGFIMTPEFNRLKNQFWYKNERSNKSLASKTQVDATFGKAEKNGEKKNVWFKLS